MSDTRSVAIRLFERNFRKCKEEGCIKKSSFNIPGKTRGKFCCCHRKEGMINIKYKLCDVPFCGKRMLDLPVEKNIRLCSIHRNS